MEREREREKSILLLHVGLFSVLVNNLMKTSFNKLVEIIELMKHNIREVNLFMYLQYLYNAKYISYDKQWGIVICVYQYTLMYINITNDIGNTVL